MSVGRGFTSITPSDSDEVAKDSSGNWPSAIRIGTGGDAVIVGTDGSTATFSNLADGEMLPIGVKQIKATGTTATGIVGIYV